MYRWVVPLFLLFISCLNSCLYATDARQYDIIDVILHKNAALSIPQSSTQLSRQQQKHAILTIELDILQKEVNSSQITYLSIQQEKGQIEKAKAYKYLTLPNFTTNKTHRINTSLGIITLKQKDFKDSYIQIPINAPLQSAALLFENERFYLIGFDNDVSIDEVQTQDSPPPKVRDTDYEISLWRYSLVLGIMFVILVALYVIRLKQNRGTESSSIVLEQVKMLDSKNKIVLMRYGDRRYLIGLNPQSITLLDTFECDMQTEKMQDNLSKDVKSQSFMQLFLKRR